MRKLARFTIVVAILLAIVIGALRATVLRWWKVPNDDPYLEASVAPTLRGGDWVLLWRRGTPSLGDLVLCPEPGKPDRVVLGRIAAMERQRIQLQGHAVFVDRDRVRSEGSCRVTTFSTVDPANGVAVEQRCGREALGGRIHLRGNAVEGQAPPDLEVSVGPGEVFLLSDNRAFPYDSRDFGTVPWASCKERVFFRLIGEAGFGDVASRLTMID